MKNTEITFIWLSANMFGYELLKEVLKKGEVEISAIVTLSSDSKVKMYDGIPPAKWHELGIKVYEIADIKQERKMLESLKPDFVVMAGWRQIIPKEILEIPKKGFIGFHPTLLPKARGPAPIINTILSGVKESGVTMFYVSEGLDDGDIIAQAKFAVDENDYAGDVYEKVIEGAKRLASYFPLLASDQAPRIPQQESEATVSPKRTLKENEINLETESPEMMLRKIRALSKPYNGAFIKTHNKKLVIWEAELQDEES
jgi:methionyl-tRNA formyltransferase